MATSHLFDGRIIKLPGAYSTIRGVASPTLSITPWSKCLIINTDARTGWGGSIYGELTKGGDAIYRLRSLGQAQSFLKSGYLWNIMTPLFNPSRTGGLGASELYYANALTTTAAKMTPVFTTGSIEIKCRDEGPMGNAVINATTGKLVSGYAMSIDPSERGDPSKFVVRFWLGEFKGMHTDGLPFEDWEQNYTRPLVVAKSPEVKSIAEFVAWAQRNDDFNFGFVISEGWVDGPITNTDAVNNVLVKATGGTASYSSTGLLELFDLMKSLDFNVILSTSAQIDPADPPTDPWAMLSTGINNYLQGFVMNGTKYGKKYLAIPGVSTGNASDLIPNIAAARNWNSEYVWLIHGSPRITSGMSPSGFREFGSLYMTAAVVGRILGLPPQVPGTFKDLAIDGLSGPIKEASRLLLPGKEDALDAGVLAVVYDEELRYFTILRAINTLQKNQTLQNEDGSTFSIQISRICTQINTDLAINAKVEVFGGNTGANANTVSTERLRLWTERFLQSKTATPMQDNLILWASNVNTERRGDSLWTTYTFGTNTEIAFAFFTGFSVT